MRLKKQLLISMVASLAWGMVFSSSLYAQEHLAASPVSLGSPEDKLQALASTRFHFIALKQFHSSLFSSAEQKKELSVWDAALLNAGLNIFLTSSERETVLLDALRKNESVQIKFPVSENEDVSTIEVKPLLDQPIAFKITLIKDGEEHLYRVDWSGHVASETVIGSLA